MLKCNFYKILVNEKKKKQLSAYHKKDAFMLFVKRYT